MEVLSRGIYTEETGRLLLACPTPEQIARVMQNPKSEYFSNLGNEPVFLPEDVLGLGYVPEKFDTYSLRNLFNGLDKRVKKKFRRVKSNFPDANVGLRGTACSLDAPVSFIERRRRFSSGVVTWEEVQITLGSFDDITKGRSENGAAAVGVEPVDLNWKERVYPIGKYPSMYLFYHPNKRRRDLTEHNVDPSAVFPILVVYNLKYCRGSFANGYYIDLPQDTKIAEDVVLGAFVLDFPPECILNR